MLVTLGYLAVQVRHGNRQAAAAIALDYIASYNDICKDGQEAEHAALLLKLEQDASLDPVEDKRAEAYVFRMLNIWLAAQQAYRYGLLEDTQYASLRADVGRLVNHSAGFQRKSAEVLESFPMARDFEIFAPLFQASEGVR